MNTKSVAVLGLWLALGATSVAQIGLSQTSQASPAPKLAAMPREVREEIDRLASTDAGKRATGALSLGQMGAKAEPAIPYLVPLLEDQTRVRSLGHGETEVGLVAGEAMVALGPKETEMLIGQLKRENNAPRGARVTAARVLGMKKVTTASPALRAALTPPDVHADFEGLYIVRALADLGDFGALGPIMTFLASKEPDSMTGQIGWQFYQKELKRFTGQDFKDRSDALAWWQMNKPTANENK